MTVNEVNTVINSFDSLYHIKPQLQNLAKVPYKYGKTTFTDTGLRYELVQGDSIEPYIWNLIEGECREPAKEDPYLRTLQKITY